MRLALASRLGLGACIVLTALLLAIGWHGYLRWRAHGANLTELIELHEELDNIYDASERMIVAEPSAAARADYHARAKKLIAHLKAYASVDPLAQRAIAIVKRLQALARAQRSRRSDGATTHPEIAEFTSSGSRTATAEQLRSLDAALNQTVHRLVTRRRQAVERDAGWLASSFAAAGTLLALVSLGLLAGFHRGVVRPLDAMRGVVERIRAGELDPRMPAHRSDELGMLASATNELLDEQTKSIERLREQQVTLAWRERMLAMSQEIAATGSYHLDLATGELTYSDEAFRLLGEAPQSFTPTLERFYGYVHPDDRAHLAAHESQSRQGTHEGPLLFRIVRRDGAVRMIHGRADTVHDAAGTPVAIRGTIQDVTELYATSEQLHQYKMLVEGSDELFDIVDSEYRYVLVNAAYARWHGHDVESFPGTPVADVLGANYFETHVRPAIDRCLAGEPQFAEIKCTGADGKQRHLLARYYPIDSPSGAERFKAGIMTDITALEETRAQLEEQSHLLEIAGRIGRLGGWVLDPGAGKIRWSDVVAEIHGVETARAPTLDEMVSFVEPAHRYRLRQLFDTCTHTGEADSAEVPIVTARGERRWIHAAGEPVPDNAGRIVRVNGALQDVSERREREWKLRQMVHVVEQSPAAIVVTDTEGRIEYANASAEASSGYSSDELLGATPALFQSGETPRETYGDLWSTIQAGQVWQGEIKNRRKNGEVYWEYEYISPLTDDRGVIVNYVAIKEDITELKRIDAELRASRDELAQALDTRQALINALPAHIALLDGEGTILDINERWRDFGRDNGFSDPQFGVGANYIRICDDAEGLYGDEAPPTAAGLRALLAGRRERFHIEYPCHSPETERWYRLEATRLDTDPAGRGDHGAVVMHVDITERKQAERELNRLAYEDTLTRLPSRNGFVRAVAQWLDRTGAQPAASVVAVDIARLRDINDTHGYAVGDALLVEVGRRLAAAAGEDGIVGRIGGDEFAVFLAARADTPAPDRRAALAATFDQPFSTDQVSVDLGARFGYTELGEAALTAEELLREAELALFRNRDLATPDPWTAYSGEIDADTRQRIEITRELRRALTEGEFELHFQPKVELATGRLLACEALIRWDHPERGLQSPGTFIPVAEQSQLIGPIGDWAIREACRRIHEWREAGLDVVPVAVNVSLVQFMVGDFTSTIRAALDAYDVPAWALSLEITESVFEQASTALREQLERIHALGVRLSLDDFGTGYSSLLYLQRYPFDEIKIDQGFVFQMLDDPYSHQVVTLVMGLAEALGVDIIAEGVENPETRDALRTLGCRRGQGYYYSMPLAPEDFRWLLEKRSPLPLGGVRPQSGAGG